MGRRKKREEAPLSLFSFQDIMACLTGILIMIALLLAIDGIDDRVTEPPPDAAAEDRDSEIRRLNEEAEDLRRRIAERARGIPVTAEDAALAEARALQAEEEAASLRLRVEEATDRLAGLERDRAEAARTVADARARELRSRIRMLPGKADEKHPVFVEPMAGGVTLGRFDEGGMPVVVAELRDPGADGAALAALGAFDPGKHYLVFVVHDDSIARFRALSGRLRSYETGWQLWDRPTSLFEGAAAVGPAMPLPGGGAR